MVRAMDGVITSYSLADAVGRIRIDDGQELRFGATALGKLFPAVGLRVRVLKTGPHPLGGLRALEIASAEPELPAVDKPAPVAEPVRELTNREHDHLPSYPNVMWRGFAYLKRIAPVLPEADGFGDDVQSGQRCWVGYLPSTDEFLVGYDLWLRSSGDDEDDRDGDDSLMAGGFTTLRLSIVGTDLAVNIVGHERFPDTVYSGALKQIEARHQNLIEIDID
jgi:hypothetical protein